MKQVMNRIGDQSNDIDLRQSAGVSLLDSTPNRSRRINAMRNMRSAFDDVARVVRRTIVHRTVAPFARIRHEDS
jgi:hypothetical protein